MEETDVQQKIDVYNKYVDTIIMWLYILNEYGSKKCSTTFTIFLYLTSLEKKLPTSNIDILDQINVNTAFTSTCPSDSEIVIFRKEEWFKVFIHETFHSFGLDFSDMNNADATKFILTKFLKLWHHKLPNSSHQPMLRFVLISRETLLASIFLMHLVQQSRLDIRKSEERFH